MDVITQSYFQDFCEKFGYESIEENRAFEYFVNYCDVSKYFTIDTITPTMLDDVATKNIADVGYDGVAVIANGKIVTQIDEVEDVLKGDGFLNVKFIFTEVKMSEQYRIESIKQFYEAVLTSFEYALGRRDFDIRLSNSITSFIQHIYSRSAKFENNSYPELVLIYNTLSSDRPDETINAVTEVYKNLFNATELFSKVSVDLMGWKELIDLYKHSTTKEEVELELPKQPIPLPKIQKAQQGYLALVPFKEFRKLIIDNSGNMKNVFSDNVRAYQGDNLVNKAMGNTLKGEDIAIFTAMNNGITIIAGQMKLEGSTLTVSDYQIVNGCQTSHVLYKHRNLKGIEELQLLVKFIASSDNEIRTKIILGANSQTEVKREQLIALSEVQELIEDYYNTIKGENRLYYERRSKQYLFDNTVPKNKVITIPVQIKAVVSMFIGRPHSIRGYYGSIVETLGSDEIFSEHYRIDIYYTSALTLYKMNELFSEGLIPFSYRKVKYHLLLAARLQAEKSIGAMPSLDSKTMEDYCQKLNKLLSDKKQCQSLFDEVVHLVRACLGREPIDQDNGSKELTERIVSMASDNTDDKIEKTAQNTSYANYMKNLIAKEEKRYVFSAGLGKAVATLSLLAGHAKRQIDILAGNLFSLEINDSMVVDQIDTFLRQGGSIRVLMYNYSLDGILSSPLFKCLAMRDKEGCKVSVQTKEVPPTIYSQGLRKRYNLFVFDSTHFRVETEDDWNKGQVGIVDTEMAGVYVSVIDRECEAEDVRSLNLLELFNLNKK